MTTKSNVIHLSVEVIKGVALAKEMLDSAPCKPCESVEYNPLRKKELERQMLEEPRNRKGKSLDPTNNDWRNQRRGRK